MKTVTRTIILSMIIFSGSIATAQDAPSESPMDMKMHEMNKADTSAYPIDFCVVSGEKLGGMGEPVKYMYEGREIQFCCNGCVKDFEKNPTKYLAVLDEAIAKSEVKEYPLDYCLVSGEKLGAMGASVDYLYQNQQIKFCCPACIKDFEKDPEKYMKMLHDKEGSE
jgi:YHS domain-containing protein